MKLKSCPFCGSPVSLKSLGDDGENWAILCEKCRIPCAEIGVNGKTKRKIIDAWNRRWNERKLDKKLKPESCSYCHGKMRYVESFKCDDCDYIYDEREAG